MASAKSRSKHHNANCQAYRANQTGVKNKRLGIERHIRNNPNDTKAPLALKSVKLTRKTPQTKVWSKTDKRLAQLFRQAGYKGNVVLRTKVAFDRAFNATTGRIDQDLMKAAWAGSHR